MVTVSDSNFRKKNLIAFSGDLWQGTREVGCPKPKKFNGTFAKQ